MRIAGITLQDNQRLEISLTAIFGIGRSRAREILLGLKIDAGKKASELTASESGSIREAIEINKIEGDLKREVSENIKRLKDIKSYRGFRHTKHLPSRGQRTKTNSRTVRGNVRKTMGSGKRKLDKK
ncbi:30S ribosomal protein S13 [Patescibacteria group bacterium]|nr:30S ribosomal protein S13 [Patescibacteria group bacterium]